MALSTILAILIAHYFSDFIMQSEEMAINKHKNEHALYVHVALYSYCMILLLFIYNAFIGIFTFKLIIFWIVTFVTHYFIDYYTSKIVNTKFTNKQYYTILPNIGAFSMIGFDQLLHYIQLFVSYYFIML